MVRRLFPTDKNYILKEAQYASKDTLLQYLGDAVKEYYLIHHNPLGLVDDTILKIQQSVDFPHQPFDEFYNDLCTLYRFKHSQVQLEFLFDGRSHFDKYTDDWKIYFKQSVMGFCVNRFFVRAVLDIVVFHQSDRVALLAGDRLKYFLENYFNLKVYKYRGVMELAS